MSRSRQSDQTDFQMRHPLFFLNRIRSIISVALPLLLLTLISTDALAGSAKAAWNPNTDPIDGYMVFVRSENQSYNYNVPVWTGTSTSCRIDGLIAGTTYYFVVRAFNGEETSGDSNEASIVASEDTENALREKSTQSLLSKSGGKLETDGQARVDKSKEESTRIAQLMIGPKK